MLLERCRADTIPELPPFQGGIAGYLGYDYGAILEHLPAPRHDDLNLPDAMLGLYDWVVAWDHSTRRSWLVSTGIPVEGAARAPARRRAAGVGQTTARRSCGWSSGAHPADSSWKSTGAFLFAFLDRHGARRRDRPPVVVHASRIPRRRDPGAGLHHRRRHLPGKPLAAPRGTARGGSLAPVPTAPRSEPGSVRRVPRVRRCLCRRALLRSDSFRWIRRAGSRPVPSRAPGPAVSRRATMPRSPNRSRRARRIEPRI